MSRRRIRRVVLLALGMSINIALVATMVPARAYVVPDTFQDRCYSDTLEIACPRLAEPYYGQDGNFVINPPDYTKLAAGGLDLPLDATLAQGWLMTRDNVTGLVWQVKQSSPDGSLDYADPGDPDNLYTWCDRNPGTNGGNAGACGTEPHTEDVIAALNNAGYGGFADWRLPTKEELRSIIHYEQMNPAVDSAFFPNLPPAGILWTTDTNHAAGSYAWLIDLSAGGDTYSYKTSANGVLAVRGPREGSASTFADNGDGTVTDLRTGLIWQQTDDGISRTWAEALAYCQALVLAGHDDWRLPTIKELASLSALDRSNPAMDTTFFPGAKPSGYWSSSTYHKHSVDGWYMLFDSGNDYLGSKDYSLFVRSVRGGHGQPPRPLAMAGVIPATISPLGDSVVTITGTGFGFAMGNGVTLDGMPLGVKSWSDTAVTMTVPPHLPGNVAVVLALSDGRIASSPAGLSYAVAEPLPPCTYDAQCGSGEYCQKPPGQCGGVGSCQPLPAMVCPSDLDPVCGCDGKTYDNACQASRYGINPAATGSCAGSSYRWTYFFPSIKDDDARGWENYLSVQARDVVPMAVTLRVYDMSGELAGTFIYSDSDPGAQARAIAPNARVAQRPSWIAGSSASPVAIEGSMIVETSVPAIASINCISQFYKGFSIYEAAKPRPVHSFPKAFDGPDNFQVYMLVQNIYAQEREVTVKLFGKTAASPGNGMTRTVVIPPFGTLKVRPSEIAGGINFDGSVVVYSNLVTAGDGLGLSLPAMCRYEVGAEAISNYESTVPQPQLLFPLLRDGKFGGFLDFQNYLSVVNPGQIEALVTIILYNPDGNEAARLSSQVIAPGGKKTWRPCWLKGSLAVPLDFAGSAVILANRHVVGQTNTIYPGTNAYGTDAFDLFESAMPASALFFPKAFDNLLGSGPGATHLFENVLAVQNPDHVARMITIEQFDNNGTANGSRLVSIAPHATHIFRPKDLAVSPTGSFRGSVRISAQQDLPIAGAMRYEFHRTTATSSPVEAMTIYRSMGQ